VPGREPTTATSSNAADPLLPGLQEGLSAAELLQPFAGSLSVFLHTALTVCERGNFYADLGMMPHLFDAEVMRQDHAHRPSRAFPWVFAWRTAAFWDLLRAPAGGCFKEIRTPSWAEFPLQQLGPECTSAGLLSVSSPPMQQADGRT